MEHSIHVLAVFYIMPMILMLDTLFVLLILAFSLEWPGDIHMHTP